MTKRRQVVSDTGAVQRIFRMAELPAVTGYSIPRLDQLLAAGQFPKPIPLGARAVGWLEADIAEWQRERIAKRDEKMARDE